MPLLMKYRVPIFWVGFVSYAVSFLLVAVGDNIPNSSPDRGYESAIWSLYFAFADMKSRLLGNDSFTHNLLESFSLLASALINVFFLGYLFASLFKPGNWVAKVLGLFVVLMIPLCWIVFHYEFMYPREGHFLWILGMLLVILSGSRVNAQA